jgi:Zn-dependent protease
VILFWKNVLTTGQFDLNLLAVIGLYILTSLFLALSVHEASHALVADLLGDPTPKQMGRLSLNPLAHLDPIGALMIMFVGLGWGKPVQIKAENLKPGPRIGMALVALAGPISNILLAAVLALPLRFHLVSLLPVPLWSSGDVRFYLPNGLGGFFLFGVWLSLGLAVFNLIPINPLDGSRLWQIILPLRWYMTVARYEIFGLAIVLGLVLAEVFFNVQWLEQILFPPIAFLWRLLVGMTPPFGL